MICLYFFSSPQQGIFKLSLNSTHQYDGVAKNVYKNTKIYITVNCEDDGDVNIGWMLRETCVSSEPSCNSFEVQYFHTISYFGYVCCWNNQYLVLLGIDCCKDKAKKKVGKMPKQICIVCITSPELRFVL